MLDGFSDAARYIGPIGAGSVAKLVHNCAGYAIQTALAEVFALGVKGGVEPLALWEAVRSRRQRPPAHLRPAQRPLPAQQVRPAELRAASSRTRTCGSPPSSAASSACRCALAKLRCAEMTEALNRGWEDRDSRSPMLLELERAGVTVAVEPPRLAAALERDPPYKGDPKRS